MDISTEFDLGQRVRHPGSDLGVGVIERIEVDVQNRHTVIESYHVRFPGSKDIVICFDFDLEEDDA